MTAESADEAQIVRDSNMQGLLPMRLNSTVRQNMPCELSPEERRLIEDELVACQDAALRRRSRYRRLFLVGVIAAVAASALREFRVPTLVTPLLEITWVVCVAAYVGLAAFPSRFMRDMDARWHLNPWQEALSSLSEGKTQLEATGLLAAPFLARGVLALVRLGFIS